MKDRHGGLAPGTYPAGFGFSGTQGNRFHKGARRDVEHKDFSGATAIASLIAAPIWAIEVPVDAVIAATPEDMTTVKMQEDSAFIGNEARTKDQNVIGLVEGVFEGPDGSQMVIVALNVDLASKSSVKTFSLPVPADSTADGSLTLGWSEAERFTALSSNLQPTDAGSDGASDGETDAGN